MDENKYILQLKFNGIEYKITKDFYETFYEAQYFSDKLWQPVLNRTGQRYKFRSLKDAKRILEQRGSGP